MRIDIPIEDGDAGPFIAEVESIVRGIATRYSPTEILVVKIDNWFGPNWLKFSGKILGALGVWKRELTVPPFVPNRVVWERRFTPPAYDQAESPHPLHISTPGPVAVTRRVSDIAPGVAMVWFSGQSETGDHGAVMAYIPVSDTYWPWYAGWKRNGSWKAHELKEITANALADLVER